MELWIVGGVVVLFILRQMWKAHTHPAQVLCRQAAHMNWVYSGTEKDASGSRNNKLKRGKYEAVVSFTNENVQLISPNHPSTFKDFIELEKWLEKDDEGGDVENDTKTALRELEKELYGEHSIAFSVIADEISNILTDSNGEAVSIQLKSGFTHNEIVHLAAKFILDRILLRTPEQ